MISSFSLARLYSKLTGDELLRLCADRGNSQACQEFLRRFEPLAMTTARRTARHYTQPHPHMCAELREFVPTHENASRGCIKVMTVNLDEFLQGEVSERTFSQRDRQLSWFDHRWGLPAKQVAGGKPVP